MNIFALDIDPEQAAKWHCDAHVIVMPKEAAQMLSTIHRIAGHHGSFYQATHRNHPCTLWARSSRENYLWLWRLGYFLCQEYTLRYGKEHRSQAVLSQVRNIPDIVPSGRLTKFPLVMPDAYKDSNPIHAYRKFYRGEKRNGRLGTWKLNKPYWWDTTLTQFWL